jgi:NADH-quinone oxidoreductase subunit F
LTHLEEGGADPNDIELLKQVGDNMMGNTICVFADAAVMPVQSFVAKFRAEFERHLALGGCPQKLATAARPTDQQHQAAAAS